MDIWELLEWNGIVCNKDVDTRLLDIEKIIKSKFEQEAIQFMVIQSNRVIIKINTLSGKSYALWDRSYWDIYAFYMFGILNIAKDRGQEGTVRLQYKTRDFLSASIMLFLALRIKDNDLSKKFAFAYRSEMSLPGSIMMEMSIESVLEDYEIAQYFVAMHEKNHCLLKNNKDSEKALVVRIENSIKFAKMLISERSNPNIKKYYGMSKGQLLRMLTSVLNDNSLKTDLICDVSAFNECLFLFLDRWKGKYTEEKIINKCLEGIRIYGYFSTLLNLLDAFWNDFNVTIEDIQEKLLSRVRRYDVSELMYMIQLSSYDFDLEEITKPDGFRELDDKNLVVQEVLNRFVNDQVRDKWMLLDVNIKEKDKYELLEWRI